MILINLANKAVNNLDFLGSVAVRVLGGLMDQDFFNQGIEHFGGQFHRVGKLLDKVNPLFYAVLLLLGAVELGGSILVSSSPCSCSYFCVSIVNVRSLIFSFTLSS